MDVQNWSRKTRLLWSASMVSLAILLTSVLYIESLPTWLGLAIGPVVIAVCVTGFLVSRRAYGFPRPSKER